MQKIDLTTQVCLEDKLNEAVDEINDLIDSAVQLTTMINTQLQLIKEQKAVIVEQNNKITAMQSEQNKFLLSIKKDINHTLKEAIKEQKIDIFQDWLKKK